MQSKASGEEGTGSMRRPWMSWRWPPHGGSKVQLGSKRALRRATGMKESEEWSRQGWQAGSRCPTSITAGGGWARPGPALGWKCSSHGMHAGMPGRTPPASCQRDVCASRAGGCGQLASAAWRRCRPSTAARRRRAGGRGPSRRRSRCRTPQHLQDRGSKGGG